MSGVIVSCAIGGVTAFCAISVLVVIRVLAMRNASTNIGFELVMSCSRRAAPAAGLRLVFGIVIFILFLPFIFVNSPRHSKPRS